MIDARAKWIWPDTDVQPEEYAFFEERFAYDGGKVVLSIAAETDYIAYVNGNVAGFGQFAGYPEEKYCDEIALEQNCALGTNTLRVIVRYEGLNSACHIDDGAGVLYSLSEDGRLLCISGENTCCGLSGEYIQHACRLITGQLGYSSGMTACAEDRPFLAKVQHRTCRVLPRPVFKTEAQPAVTGVSRELSQGRVYDLGRETAGYVFLRAKSDSCRRVKLIYGEHVTDGRIRRIIGGRDFSLDFDLRQGENRFVQRFVRVAGRYLALESEEGLEDIELGMIPYLYPQKEKERFLQGLDGRVYDTCVRTLRLCMNLHYEDCPWREQALYVLDSRNQMLCGYAVFEEHSFQRANLVFMSKGGRGDGFLELTYPAVKTPAIPFFSLMYPVAVWEYVEHTGDQTILPEVMETVHGILQAMAGQIRSNGLAANLPAPFWNFYEWSEGSDGNGELGSSGPRKERFDLLLNCAFAYAMEKYALLCAVAQEKPRVDDQGLKKAIIQAFYHEETGLFHASDATPGLYTQLGNAFALLIGLGDERTLRSLREDSSLVPATLSMIGYVYDALIPSSRENALWVLQEMRRQYGFMLEKGATSFWETIRGEADFDSAGSLCHGWSAMPAHYYHLFREMGLLDA